MEFPWAFFYGIFLAWGRGCGLSYGDVSHCAGGAWLCGDAACSLYDVHEREHVFFAGEPDEHLPG